MSERWLDYSPNEDPEPAEGWDNWYHNQPPGEPPTLPFVRVDKLPEGVDWKDNGCAVAPACLACPLSQCRLDHPTAYSAEARARRAEMVWRWRVASSLSVTAIARALKCSPRTIQRILQAGRPDGGFAGITPGPAEPARDPALIYKPRRPWPAMRSGVNGVD